MHTSDEVIDRVMSALSAIEPEEGLERRVLTALSSRVHQPAHTIWRFNPLLAWPLGAVSLAVVALVFFLVQHQQPKPANNEIHAGSSATQPQQHEGAKAIMLPSQITPHQRRNSSRQSSAEISPLDERALLETRAPSHPAPDAPLTEEERLLSSIVQQETPQLFAMLNPEMRHRQEEAEEAEFERFFDPSGADNLPQ